MKVKVEKQTLTKKEKELMRVVYTEAEKRDGICLLTPFEILERIPYDFDFKEDELEPTLRDLELDDYLEKIDTDKKGELVYFITLNKKGMAFKRKEDLFKRSLRFKIFITIVFAMFSALIGTLIKFLLKKIIPS